MQLKEGMFLLIHNVESFECSLLVKLIMTEEDKIDFVKLSSHPTVGFS